MVGRIFIMFLCALLLIALRIGLAQMKSEHRVNVYSGVVETSAITSTPRLLLTVSVHVADLCYLAWVCATVCAWFERAGLGVSLLNHAAAMARLGLPLRQGLARCAGRLGKVARQELAAVLCGLDHGQLLGDALSRPLSRTKRGELGPNMIGLVTLAEAETLRTGEMTGNLGEAVAMVVEGRRSGWRRSRSLWGMVYAFLVLAYAALVGVGFFLHMGPRLVMMFREFAVTLPPATLLLLSVGTPLSAGMCLAGFLGLLWIAVARVGGGWTVGRLPLALRWVLGAPAWALGVGRRRWLARVCHDLAMLLRVGTPAPRALDILAEGTSNPWRAARLRKAARLCGQGVDLGAALNQARVDPAAAWVAGVQAQGEEISAALRRLGDEYVARAAWAERVALEVGSLVIVMAAALFAAGAAFGFLLPIWRLASGV